MAVIVLARPCLWLRQSRPLKIGIPRAGRRSEGTDAVFAGKCKLTLMQRTKLPSAQSNTRHTAAKSTVCDFIERGIVSAERLTQTPLWALLSCTVTVARL